MAKPVSLPNLLIKIIPDLIDKLRERVLGGSQSLISRFLNRLESHSVDWVRVPD